MKKIKCDYKKIGFLVAFGMLLALLSGYVGGYIGNHGGKVLGSRSDNPWNSTAVGPYFYGSGTTTISIDSAITGCLRMRDMNASTTKTYTYIITNAGVIGTTTAANCGY